MTKADYQRGLLDAAEQARKSALSLKIKTLGDQRLDGKWIMGAMAALNNLATELEFAASRARASGLDPGVEAKERENDSG